ncbi:LOW QUALITY PROTEIN: hypothetical protein TorRG33x02_075510 [Trema orientale]|uniref:Uncharacterized protein n=1 Tax=Trema orientale TaxID=63057 RepID=A0A2P5FFJ7_TREOI|nr:LOW QUALITY PROTEIN: hypothetical protein TorRG33x02_075510 [Trema orientale]
MTGQPYIFLPHTYFSFSQPTADIFISISISVLFLHNRTRPDLHSSSCSTFTSTQSHVYGSPSARPRKCSRLVDVCLINIAVTDEALVCTNDWLFGNKDNPHTRTDEMEELIKNIMELSMEDESLTQSSNSVV